MGQMNAMTNRTRSQKYKIEWQFDRASSLHSRNPKPTEVHANCSHTAPKHHTRIAMARMQAILCRTTTMTHTPVNQSTKKTGPRETPLPSSQIWTRGQGPDKQPTHRKARTRPSPSQMAATQHQNIIPGLPWHECKLYCAARPPWDILCPAPAPEAACNRVPTPSPPTWPQSTIF